MFDLVADVEKYPDFLPWCGGASVQSRHEDGMQASIIISIAGIKQTFTTRNRHHRPDHIVIDLVDGPFSALEGNWNFQALGEHGCKVVYIMEYAFASRALEMVVGPIFNRIASSFIDSFTQRAQDVYGE